MIYWKHFKSIVIHKWFVFLAGLRLGVPVWRLVVHDWQKFTHWEFKAYARNFQFKGEKAEKAGFDFSYAWLHHENTAPHHWGYWIPRAGRYANMPLPMPETYVREMVADWLGASRAYTGSWDMHDWLQKNLSGIVDNMCNETWDILEDVLIEIGYENLLTVFTVDQAIRPAINHTFNNLI